MAGFNNDKNFNATSIGNGLNIYAEINREGEEPILFELGTCKDIQVGSQRMIGSITKNGSNRVKGYQRGIRNTAGAFISATIGKKTASYMKDLIGERVGSEMADFDFSGDASGPGIDIEKITEVSEDVLSEVSLDAFSLTDLPPINIVILAKGDVVRQLGVDITNKLGHLDRVEGYNVILEKRLNGVKFMTDGSGLDAGEGFGESASQFMLFGAEGPWKMRGE